MALTQYTRAALGNSLFGNTSNFGALATAPAIYVGLSSTTPTTTGTNITEPSTGAYARVSVPAASWASATSADPSVVENSSAIIFPTATASWLAGVNLTYFVMFDALTAGNCLSFGALSTPKPVLTGDTASIPVDDLQTTLT